MANAGQVLARQAAAPPTVDAFRKELEGLHVEHANGVKSLASYEQALSQISQQKLDDAVASLQESIRQVPTAAANLTLAGLLDKQRRRTEARQATAEASMLAQQRGDTFGSLRADAAEKQISQHEAAEDPSNNTGRYGSPLVGDKRRFPSGGKTLETAPVIAPDTYIDETNIPDGENHYYKLKIQPRQKLTMMLRLRDNGADCMWIGLADVNGAWGNRKSRPCFSADFITLTHDADAGPWAYVVLSGDTRGAVFAINVR